MSAQAQQQEIVEFTDENSVQYLTFQLDGEPFATEIDNVREVLEYTKITRVPRTPEHMLGVLNLRGMVVPVVDLRLQFNMNLGERTVDTCIIIIEVVIDETLTVIGALADSVQEVINLMPDQLSPAPSLGTRISDEYIRSMGKHNELFISILNLDVVFTLDSEIFTSLAQAYHHRRIEQISNDELIESANDLIVEEVEEESVDTSSNNTNQNEELGIDLDSAIQKHAQWKLKLHTAIVKKDTLDAVEISRDDCCVLGKWLHGDAKSKYSDLGAYKECVDQHRSFHGEAAKVAKMINSKLYEQAEAMLGRDTPYITVSKSVAAAIVALRNEIE